VIFPRLLVVTDADLSASSRGAGRTLLNILSGWPAESVRVVSTLSHSTGADAHGHRIFESGDGGRHPLLHRMRTMVGDVHAQLAAIRPLNREVLSGFDPELVLVVPTEPAALVVGHRWAEALALPSATWLMDDWIQQYPTRWITGSCDSVGRALLARNAGWLVISDYLGEELRRWTGLKRPTHVVHNAVSIGAPPEALTTPRTGTFVLRYAGTIWPMHADALAILARAVAEQRASGVDIELVLHCDTQSWDRNASVWRETGTGFGGIVPYEKLRAKLADSDLLVVASSFANEHVRMTRSSVQTKITDYLASGRAILNVGPPDGACTRFLRERDIAVYIDSPQVSIAENTLRRLVEKRDSLLSIAARGWELVKRDHEISAVSRATGEFLGTLKR
jgi:hypothetical protein